MPNKAEEPQATDEIAAACLDIVRPGPLGYVTGTIEDVEDRNTDLATAVAEDAFVRSSIPITDGPGRQ